MGALMRRFFLALAALALSMLSAGNDVALAQAGPGERIERISNRRLSGNAYASLRGLTFQQCEKRCLADRQCTALEHTRGGSVVAGANASQCKLFRSFGTAQASADSDVGLKRPALAAKAPPHAPPKVTATPPAPMPHKPELKAA